MSGMTQSTQSRGQSNPHQRLLVIAALVLFFVGLVVLVPMLIVFLSGVGYSDDGPRSKCTNDIAWLDTAIQNFKTTYKVDYIPSRLFLAERFSDYATRPSDTLAQDSLAYLLRLWPQLLGNGGWFARFIRTAEQPEAEMVEE